MILIVLILLVVFSLAVIEVKNLIHAVILLGICNSLMSLSYFLLKALDVALTEAAIGAGLTTIIFMIALKKMGVFEE